MYFVVTQSGVPQSHREKSAENQAPSRSEYQHPGQPLRGGDPAVY